MVMMQSGMMRAVEVGLWIVGWGLPLSSIPSSAALAAEHGMLRPSSADGAAVCGSCAACGGALIAIPIVLFVLNVALLVWVARDAKARGMDSAVLWMILVMFTSLIGLMIYMFSRPQGQVVQCAHCNNRRLQASAKCPHCGNS